MHTILQKWTQKNVFFSKRAQDFELLKQVPEPQHQTVFFGRDQNIGTSILSLSGFPRSVTWLSTSTSTSISKTTASFNLYLNINTFCQHQHQTGNQHIIITINIKINNQHDQGRAGWGQCSTPGKQAGHLHEQGGTHASTGEDDGHGGDYDLYIMIKCLFVCHEK